MKIFPKVLYETFKNMQFASEAPALKEFYTQNYIFNKKEEEEEEEEEYTGQGSKVVNARLTGLRR